MRIVTIGLFFLVVLAGCGQTGPLYLPDHPQHASHSSARQPAYGSL